MEQFFDKKSAGRAVFWLLTLIIVFSASTFFPQAPTSVFAAQSTSDTLPTRTPTPLPPTSTATAAATQANTVWLGRLVDTIPGFTNGGGAIFRVSVEGMDGTSIELRSDDQLIAANSGSKPEIGPFAAEFAPVTEGTWTVSVPLLDVSLNVATDNYNLMIIEFVEVPEAEATQAAVTPPTPTPLSNITWEGEVTSEFIGAGGPFARLLVKVLEREGHPVQLSTLSQVINTANTGQKPDELGPHTVEFAGLTPGKYIVEPLGLDISVEVELKPDVVTQVEIRPQAEPATPTATATVELTPTPIGAIANQTPTSEPVAATPTPSPVPTQVAPEPSPVPISRWLGVVDDRAEAGLDPSSIVVTVDGVEDTQVTLRTALDADLPVHQCVTGQGSLGSDSCVFEEVMPGSYIIEPEGFALSLPVQLYEHEKMQVRFFIEELPPEIVGWTARIGKNTNGFGSNPQASSAVRIRSDEDLAGLVISLHSVQDTTHTCELAPLADLNEVACNFTRLRAGVYRVVAETMGASRRLFVDGEGEAEITLAPDATLDSVAQALSAPIVGHGAQPRVAAPPTAAPVQVSAQLPTAIPSPTVAITPTLVITPTPALEWQARIVETGFSGAGAIGVRVVDVKDQPIVLSSGDWKSQPQMTGSKPELGNYAVEFGGLAQGEYIIDVVDLTEYRVSLEPGQFVLVEFNYLPVE